ncbi:MAG: hypothetical protein Kilf2KO_36950 [Rhodospirillales bacterium]
MYDVKTVRELSTKDLAALGLGQVAYLKPIVIDGQKAIAIHAANGLALGAVPSSLAALAALRDNDLEEVLLN